MSTDREMLELAAKAAGYVAFWETDYIRTGCVDGRPWNPLTDDGDALRLAVKLRISIDYDNRREQVWVYGVTTSEDYGADVEAATRRAIVRAAAELGRKS